MEIRIQNWLALVALAGAFAHAWGQTPEVRIVQAGGGEHLAVVGDVVSIKATASETGGQMLVMEVAVSPGGGPPMLHRHPTSEVFFILEGAFEIATAQADGTRIAKRATVGDTVVIESNAWHTYRNVGATPGRFLAIHSPAKSEAFFREIGTRLAEPRLVAGEPPGEDERKRILGVVRKYFEILPPAKPAPQ